MVLLSFHWQTAKIRTFRKIPLGDGEFKRSKISDTVEKFRLDRSFQSALIWRVENLGNRKFEESKIGTFQRSGRFEIFRALKNRKSVETRELKKFEK